MTPTGTTTNARPLFSWKPVDGAVRYELWVTNTTTNTQVINQTSLSTLNYTPSASLAKASYRVWVRAVSTSGELGPWSDQTNFTIAAVTLLSDPLNPELLLTRLLVSEASRDSVVVRRKPQKTEIAESEQERQVAVTMPERPIDMIFSRRPIGDVPFNKNLAALDESPSHRNLDLFMAEFAMQEFFILE